MKLLGLCLVLGLLGLAEASPGLRATATDTKEDQKYKLPDDFLFGAGTSAYQTEGAWDQDGKGVNQFDYYYHTNNVSLAHNGDIAANAYNRYEEDIGLAHELGLNVLRISISWSRIFPDGFAIESKANKKGVDHYHDVFKTMAKHNITPIVTIFHFDYPQILEKEWQGWLSSNMSDEFARYAEFLFKTYGDEVKHWLTVNEASMYCNLAADRVPPFTMTGNTEKCLHNLILGHAKAYRIYEKNYKATQNGMVGFGIGPNFNRPNSDSAEDIAASDASNLKSFGVSLHPLVYGDYPDIAKSGRPNFTDTEKEQYLNGVAIDFAGVNVYGGRNVSASGGGGGDDGPGGGGGGPPGGGGSGGDGPPGGGGSGGGGPPGGGGSGGGGPPGGGGSDGGGPPGGGGGGGGSDGCSSGEGHGSGATSSSWTLREIPKWINKTYGEKIKMPVFYTENGLATGSCIDDYNARGAYFSAYLREMAVGINEDHNNVIGYTAWSFIDTFEFGSYGMGWGLVHVDYENGSLNRTLKTSSKFIQQLTKTKIVPLVPSSGSLFARSSLLTLVALFTLLFLQ